MLESPWWLVRKGRIDDAEKVLAKLSSDKVDVASTLAVIIETGSSQEQERDAAAPTGTASMGDNWRRTEISIGVYCTQVLSGIYLINYGTYFFQQAGLPDEEAFDMGIGFLGTYSRWFLLANLAGGTFPRSTTVETLANMIPQLLASLALVISWFLLPYYG